MIWITSSGSKETRRRCEDGSPSEEEEARRLSIGAAGEARSEAHSAGVSRRLPDGKPGGTVELEGASNLGGGGTGGGYMGGNVG